MKNLSVVVFLVSILFLSCKENPKKEQSNEAKLSNKVEVIDFHSTHRCMTCNAIEANTKYTLDTFFSEAVESGEVTLQVVNVDLEENAAMAEKFEATGTSLFLNVIVDGKETPIDLTEFAFMNGTDEATFSKELKAIIEAELKKV